MSRAVTSSSWVSVSRTWASSPSSRGISPTLRLTRRRLSQSFSRPWTWEKETSSSPEEARAAMRRSSWGAEVTESWSPPRKAERANTSAPAPVSSSPQVSPVRPGTGSWVPVYTAEKAPKGAFPRGPRRMVTDRPSHSSSSSPSMGAPDQG